MSVNQPTDAQIVELILQGRLEAFAEIVKRYQEKLLRYVMRLLNFHRQDSEDIVSETFYKAFSNLRRFNPKHSFSSWIYRIAHNLVMDHFRKNKQLRLVELKPDHAVSFTDWDKPSARDIEKVLSGLSLPEREILTLYYLEDQSLAAISRILGLLPGTVKVRLHRARQKARHIVEKTYPIYASKLATT